MATEHEIEMAFHAIKGALEFYATPERFVDENGDTLPVPSGYGDLKFGQRAADALKALALLRPR
jgi:hypothetical protein